MSLIRIGLGFTLAAFATVAAAQDKRPDYGPSINIGNAKKVAAAVIAECTKNSWNVAVAVVDPHGFLVYFERNGEHAVRQHGHRHRQGEGCGHL